MHSFPGTYLIFLLWGTLSIHGQKHTNHSSSGTQSTFLQGNTLKKYNSVYFTSIFFKESLYQFLRGKLLKILPQEHNKNSRGVSKLLWTENNNFFLSFPLHSWHKNKHGYIKMKDSSGWPRNSLAVNLIRF